MDGRSAGRGIVASLGGQWTKYVLQIVAFVVLARLLEPEDFGIMAMVLAIVGIANVVGDFGLSLAAVQAEHLHQSQKSNLFWINTAIGLVMGIAAYVSAPAIANLYGETRLEGLIQLIAIVFPLNGLAVQFRVEINREFRFDRLAYIDVLSQLLAVAAAVLAAVNGAEYWALGVQSVVLSLVALIFGVYWARWMPGLWTRRSGTAHFVRFGANTFSVQVLNYVSSNLDSVLIGRIFGAVQLGLYSRAFQLVALPIQQIASPLTRVVLPYLSRFSESGKSLGFGDVIVKINLMMAYSLLAVLSMLAAASEPLLSVMLGEAWSPAAPLVETLALGGAFQALGYTYYWIFLARAATGLLALSELPGRVLMIGLMLSTAQFGTVWVAGSAAAGLAVIWLTGTFFTVPRLGIDTVRIVRASVRPLLLYGTAWAVCRLIRWHLPELSDILLLGVVAAVWLLIVLMGYLAVPAIRRDMKLVAAQISRMLARRK
jgi:O-antigen/teichoic acid export membrane protein